MLKVWGRVNSINVQKVLWALDELQVAYERAVVDSREDLAVEKVAVDLLCRVVCHAEQRPQNLAVSVERVDLDFGHG